MASRRSPVLATCAQCKGKRPRYAMMGQICAECSRNAPTTVLCPRGAPTDDGRHLVSSSQKGTPSMAVRSIPTTAPVGSSPVLPPAPSGAEASGYAVTRTGPASPATTATWQGNPTGPAPYNDVNE